MNFSTKRELQKKLREYPHIKNEVAIELADIYTKGMCCNYQSIGGAKNSITGIDDTLIKYMSSPKYLWCKAIEDTLKDFEYDSKLIQLKFFGNKITDTEISIKTRYSRALIYVRLNEFYDQLHKYCIKYGLLDVN